MNECLACGKQNLVRIRSYRTHTNKGKEVFAEAALYECSDCGMVQSIPRPNSAELERYYQHSYRSHGYGGSDVADVSQFPNDNLFYCNRGQSITELLTPFVTKNDLRILDVGAGYGHILYFLGKQFPQSTRSAVELSKPCVEHLQSRNIQVFTRPVEEVLSEMPDHFELVTLSHVLEHLLDPRAVLRLIHSSLAKDGLLYLEVPNIPPDSLLRYPDHMWAPRFDEPHITFISETTLIKLVESAGFRLKFSSTAGPFYRYVSAFRYRMPPFRESIANCIPGSVFRFLRRQKITKAVRVQEREESFFQYGGFRLWIRSVWKKQ